MKNLTLRAVVGIGVCAAVILALAAYGADDAWGWWLALRLVILAACLWELWRMQVRGKWWVAAFVVFSTMVPLHYMVEGWSAAVILSYIFIIWASDVGAYLVGSTLGRLWRSKLAPQISPNKTWAGVFGGLAAGIGVALWAAHECRYWQAYDGEGVFPEFDVWGMLQHAELGKTSFWVGLAVVTVVTGVIGDLAESWLKRRAGVKDSSHMLPGHGGMLDRFDSLLFSAPFVWAYFLIFA